MNDMFFYTAGNTAPLSRAELRLTQSGCVFLPFPKPVVTHLLLPVPSIEKGDTLRGGGSLSGVLARLPENITIIGGNLPPLPGYRVWDLLKDPIYVAENAYITAQCALQLGLEKLTASLRGCRILIIGWGRIGKCLAAMLKALEADVTIAARKESDRAIIHALGYHTTDTTSIEPHTFRIIYNTAPAMVLPDAPDGCIKIDLASQTGIGGNDVILARGLPGLYASEASGDLIAETVLRLLKEAGQV